MSKPLLQLDNITKQFGTTTVLNQVSLTVYPGEIHGLVGANGSGKSTLLNIIAGSGVIAQTGGYQGTMRWEGQPILSADSGEMMRLGVGMVHQELNLLENMSVVDNLCLGREKTRAVPWLPGLIRPLDRQGNLKKAQQLLEETQIQLPLDRQVKDLTLSHKYLLEILKEIDRPNLKLLLLDEPTAALDERDSKQITDLICWLSRQGVGIVFISHRLEEVVSICHRITVLRGGSVVARYEKEAFDIHAMTLDMFQKYVNTDTKRGEQTLTQPVLEFDRFSVDMPGERLESLTMPVYKGEILGITSLAGHGKLAVANGVFGVYPSTGKVIHQGLAIGCRNGSAAAALECGMAFLPEERQGMGLLSEWSVAENLIFSAMAAGGKHREIGNCRSLSVPDRDKVQKFSLEQIDKYHIQCVGPSQKIKELSGGNQQKVCIARVLALRPQILFISEPTRGIDIHAKKEILSILSELNQAYGTTIIIASSELEELRSVCGRIAVLYEGKLVDVLPCSADSDRFSMAISGMREENCSET